MGHLTEGVNSGVGSARPVEANGFPGNFGEGFFDSLLDGVSIGLNLPSGKGGAVVGDGDFQMHL